jgi:hypothetical protein
MSNEWQDNDHQSYTTMIKYNIWLSICLLIQQFKYHIHINYHHHSSTYTYIKIRRIKWKTHSRMLQESVTSHSTNLFFLFLLFFFQVYEAKLSQIALTYTHHLELPDRTLQITHSLKSGMSTKSINCRKKKTKIYNQTIEKEQKKKCTSFF